MPKILITTSSFAAKDVTARNLLSSAGYEIITNPFSRTLTEEEVTRLLGKEQPVGMIAGKFPKANINTILDAIGTDTRIGHKYLRAGLSYGGPCFPRDNRLLSYAARQVGLEAPLAEASDKTNQMTKSNLVEKVRGLTSAAGTVLILGVSYKPDTYITEESAGLHLAQELKRNGYRVLVHDYAANRSNNPALQEFEIVGDLLGLETRKDIELAVVCCPWPQYAKLKFSPATKVLPTWKL